MSLQSERRSPFPILLGGIAAALAVALFAVVYFNGPKVTPRTLEAAQDAPRERSAAPEFPEKLDWLNTAGPIKLADLKGKVVILDFWTLCCINCIHILPDLAKLEKKYENELVVIGVHAAKFDNEKETKSIRKAVLRYEIAHPVVNDAEHGIWKNFGVRSWPTFVVIDAEGKYYGFTNGEGQLEVLDKTIAKLVTEAKDKKILNDKPIRFDLVRFREQGDSALFFPGKILADEKSNRLFIADSTHHRVIVTDLAGKKQAIIGTGSPGRKDGKFDAVQFDDPQGLALDGDTLYIADRKNHQIRAADLKAGTVKTIAGTGEQDRRSRGQYTPVDAAKMGLNSPWDLLFANGKLFIAMAGHHQIWTMDVKANKIQAFAGDGAESIEDGPLHSASFAQPSGLSADDKYLYIADSEGSAIRRIPLSGEGRANTLVGVTGDTSLFNFGDLDGIGDKAKLQHALAVVSHNGKLIIADTYNSKIKEYDPATKATKTLLGGVDPNDKAKGPLFNEPAGMSVAAGKLYVADTNAHRIRVVDLKTQAVSTLELTDVKPPPPQKEWLSPEVKKK